MDNEILPLIDFSKVKKKRRLEEPDNDDQEDQDLDDFISMKKRKKGKKKKSEKNETNTQEIENEDPNNTNGAYSYDFLLKRLYNIMKPQKDSNVSSEMKIPGLVLGKGSNDRTTWVNFEKVANVLGRSKDHLFQFVMAELSVEATLGGEGQMFFKTKQSITTNTLRNIIQKYINEYIRCPNCKSFKTILRKDQSTRLPQIYCEVCKGAKTIQQIKSRGGAGKKKK